MKIEEAGSEDYYDECWFYTKGWVDKDEFLDKVCDLYGMDREEDDTDDVIHGYIRVYGKKDKMIYFDTDHKAHRGCFKGTFINMG